MEGEFENSDSLPEQNEEPSPDAEALQAQQGEGADGAAEGGEPDAPEKDESAELRARMAAALNELQDRERALYEIQRERDTVRQELEQLQSLKAKLTENPLSVLEEQGITFEQLAEKVLSGDGATKEDLKLREIERRNQELAQKVEAWERQQAELRDQESFKEDLQLVQQTLQDDELTIAREILGDEQVQAVTRALRDRVAAGERIDLKRELKQMQDQTINRIREVLRRDPVRDAILSDQELRAVLAGGANSGNQGEKSDPGAEPQTNNLQTTITNELAARAGNKAEPAPKPLRDDEIKSRMLAKVLAMRKQAAAT